ncbi:MAG: putative O-methyltransferase YrrM [Candidatus Krumholzibacteriia bacterium]|jgi:predicted O-methyltransferase YrrM
MVIEPNSNGAHDLAFLKEDNVITQVNNTWDEISEEYSTVYQQMPNPPMERSELSFHEQVKLLGYLCLDTYQLPGDILEIGVWKGKSLSLMARLCQRGTKIIGVDPCEIKGQREELSVFIKEVLPDADLTVIVEHSERAVRQVASISRSYKIIHIDGGHQAHHVWTDFMLYGRFLAPGGYLVFDDYADKNSSPEVKTAVDELFRAGLFSNFDVLGPINGFLNSFVLKKSK